MPVRTRKRLYGPRLPEEYNWTSITKPHNGDVYENTLTGDLYTCINADEPNDAISWYIMPLPGSIPTHDGVVVSGAGTAEANGPYRFMGARANTFGWYYNLDGQPDNEIASSILVDTDNVETTFYAANGDVLYDVSGQATYPNLIDWTGSEVDGDSPAPTVTAEYLTLTGLPYGYTILGPGGFEYKFIGAAGTESDAGSWVATPKVYVANANQSGTPLDVTVGANSLGGVPVWTHPETGKYVITLAGAFTDPTKVYPITASCNEDPAGILRVIWVDANTLWVLATVDGSPQDDTLNHQPFWISIYP